jgi:hypothetical protein
VRNEKKRHLIRIEEKKLKKLGRKFVDMQNSNKIVRQKIAVIAADKVTLEAEAATSTNALQILEQSIGVLTESIEHVSK